MKEVQIVEILIIYVVILANSNSLGETETEQLK